MNNEVVLIEYDDLLITRVGRVFAPDDWEEWTDKVYWTYEADKQNVEEFLVNYIDIEDSSEAYKYLEQHFDEYVEKYKKELQDRYREQAREDAEENYEVN